MTLTWWRALLLAPLATCAVVPVSCGSDDATSATAAGGTSGAAGKGGKAGKGGTAGSGTGAAGSAGQGAAATGGCAPGPVPADLPGWEEFTDYSCDCRFYIPGESGERPEPVTWEPCTWKYTEGLACQRMRVPWTADGKYGHTAGTAMTWWQDRTTGEVWMAFGRTRHASNPDRWISVTARVDDAGGGKVYDALAKEVPFCFANMVGVQGGRYALKVTGGPKKELVEDPRYRGLIAGVVGHRPSVVKQYFLADTSELHASWMFSRSWIYEVFFQTYAHPFGDFEHPVPVDDTKVAKGYTKFGGAAVVGDGLMFQLRNGASQEAGIYWSQPTGFVPLAMYAGGTLAAERVGSDGDDLVWTEVDYASGDQWTYPRRTMTAKWSTDVGVNMATKRDLGVDLPYSDSGNRAWTVGCGYAAKAFHAQLTAEDLGSSLLRIVRLADGATWTIAGEPPAKPAKPGAETFYWSDVYGITCDEVWVSATNTADSGFYRIRLDSLGAPSPAVHLLMARMLAPSSIRPT